MVKGIYFTFHLQWYPIMSNNSSRSSSTSTPNSTSNTFDDSASMITLVEDQSKSSQCQKPEGPSNRKSSNQQKPSSPWSDSDFNKKSSQCGWGAPTATRPSLG
ncbi:hypothetical protein CC2G_012676 [Coprinopsis cinerea AmutBmut pab1-1]|nr:hypothetical protein CC2G_012676 [Coprinopsis cinerea AmutBmut pab1-1]